MRTLCLVVTSLLLSLGCGSTHAGGDAGPRLDGAPEADSGPNACVIATPAEHRASAVVCSGDRLSPEIDPIASGDCTTHAECTDGDNGRCLGDGRSNFHQCSYDTCFADSDCGSGPCDCGADPRRSANRCLSGNCQVDADCGADGFCSPTLGSCGNFGGVVGYYCRTCDDECTYDSDCTNGGTDPNAYCAYNDAVGHWTCSTAQCAG